MASRRTVQPVAARGGFSTTHWSLIAQVAPGGSRASSAALEDLCRRYWNPVYCFARRQVATREDAEDLTQGFFADLLSRGALWRADQERGKFRTFLLCSFKNFCSHERGRTAALKRGGGQTILSLDALQEAELANASPGQQSTADPAESSEQFFDRQWALRLIEQALVSVRASYVLLGEADLFDALKPVLWAPVDRYELLAQQIGSTPRAIKVAVFRLRRRVGHEIREEVAKTVADPAMIDDEMRYLRAAVAQQSPPV